MANESENKGTTQYPVWLTLLNMLLSGGSYFIKIGMVAGHEIQLTVIAVVAGMLGSIVGFKTQKQWGWVFVAGAAALGALRYYTSLLAQAGLTKLQSYFAWGAYAFIFFVAAWIAMLLELLVKRGLQKKNASTDSNESEPPN